MNGSSGFQRVTPVDSPLWPCWWLCKPLSPPPIPSNSCSFPPQAKSSLLPPLLRQHNTTGQDAFSTLHSFVRSLTWLLTLPRPRLRHRHPTDRQTPSSPVPRFGLCSFSTLASHFTPLAFPSVDLSGFASLTPTPPRHYSRSLFLGLDSPITIEFRSKRLNRHLDTPPLGCHHHRLRPIAPTTTFLSHPPKSPSSPLCVPPEPSCNWPSASLLSRH